MFKQMSNSWQYKKFDSLKTSQNFRFDELTTERTQPISKFSYLISGIANKNEYFKNAGN
jgi:hypothetical protein